MEHATVESFVDASDRLDFGAIAEQLSDRAAAFTAGDVRRALDHGEGLRQPEDLSALLSPAAAPFLEEQAHRAQAVTRRRFGRTMQLYAPLYLSNECASICTYCGFRRDNQIRRLTLTPRRAVAEARILKDQGIRHILLLTGEDYRRTPPAYLEECVRLLSEDFSSVSIEVYPLETEDYSRLREAGVDGLAVYQETYDRQRYHQVHTGGMKKNWAYRLACPERAGEAGIRKIALGALLGLSDPAAEVYMLGLHARFLMKRFWRTQFSISLPRLRPAVGVSPNPSLSDRSFVQYLTALRLFLPDVGLTLSTRESPELRDNLAKICITAMSAGSKTDPGGYSGSDAGEQFSIEDTRTVAQVRAALESMGLEPVFHDWAYVMK